MIKKDGAAEINFHKAMSAKNNRISLCLFGMIAFVTVLLPMLVAGGSGMESAFYMIIVFIASMAGGERYLWMKYKEYRSAYTMLASVPYADEYAILYCAGDPARFEDGDLATIVSYVYAETLLDKEETIQEMRNYYKNIAGLEGIAW